MGDIESRVLAKNEVVHGYKIVGRLGTGTFADVYKAVDTSTDRTVALKRFKELRLDVGDVKVEIESLQIAAHKNVVRYLNSFNDENTMYLVIEFCELGHIEDFIKAKRPNDKTRMGFIRDIAAGVAHLHSLRIAHRDLKPANILISSQECIAKLADFGLAKMTKPAEGAKKMEEIYMDTMAGTYVYMAPEVPKGHYNAQADIFSMGIVFCGILDDKLKENIEKELVGLKMHMVPGYSYTVPANIGKFMQKLITGMLQMDFHLRPKAHDISTQLMQHGKKSQKVDLKSIKLLAAGMSACLGVVVLPPGEASSLPNAKKIQKITLHDLFHFTNPVVFNSHQPAGGSDDTMVVHDVSNIDVMFKSIGGSSGKVKISKNARAAEMRSLIASQSGIPVDSLELFHRNWAVGDDQSIEKEGIRQGAVIHVHFVNADQKGTMSYEMDKGLLDPQFNYDFTKIDDGNKQFVRGGHVYQRPCGWYRHALKVKGQYENDIWLGDLGTRAHSSPKEWPVSYHGSKMTSDNIPIGGNAGSAQRGLNGIVTTPSLHMVADKYVQSFEFEGSTYQIALQNRINPDQINGHMEVIAGEGTADYWLSTKEDPSKRAYDVRPYGILIRKIDGVQ